MLIGQRLFLLCKDKYACSLWLGRNSGTIWHKTQSAKSKWMSDWNGQLASLSGDKNVKAGAEKAQEPLETEKKLTNEKEYPWPFIPVDYPHPATIDPDKLHSMHCSVTHTKGSGPGGQHRNKVQTAVVLQHDDTGIIGKASESRSQIRNFKMALFRLRLELAIKCRTTEQENKTTVEELSISSLWKSRLNKGKILVNSEHVDYPALLAEALDRIQSSRDVKAASSALKISTSQLVKLLSKEKRSLDMVNEMRLFHGLPKLRY